MLDTPLTRGLVTAPHEPPRSLDPRVASGGLHGGPRWYCAWTGQQRERRVADAIAAAGFESYLPLHLERDVWRNTTIGPLFQRYVFCRFDRDLDPWGKITAIRAVCGLIQHGPGLPTSLPDVAILDLQARTSSRGVVDDPGEAAWKGVQPDYAPVWAPMAGLDAGARSRLLIRLFGASASRIVTEDAA